jgi:hypothetical protein
VTTYLEWPRDSEPTQSALHGNREMTSQVETDICILLTQLVFGEVMSVREYSQNLQLTVVV